MFKIKKRPRSQEDIPDHEKIDLDDPISQDDGDFSNDPLFSNDFDDPMYDDMGGAQTPISKHGDLLKQLTNFAPYLKDTFNNWLGISWDEEQGKYVRNPLIRPVMNFNGAAWCLGFLKTYARRNNIITDIGGQEYQNIMGDIVEAVWLNLGTRPELGVASDGDLLRVCNEMEHAASLALMGAGDGKYNKFLGTTYTHHTNASENERMQTGGLARRKDNAIQKMRNWVTR